jgi:hypothetical protein
MTCFLIVTDPTGVISVTDQKGFLWSPAHPQTARCRKPVAGCQAPSLNGLCMGPRQDPDEGGDRQTPTVRQIRPVGQRIRSSNSQIKGA